MIDVHGVMWLPVMHFYLLLALSTLGSLYAIYRMLTRLRRARWVEDTPTSRVRSAAQGLVELKGQLEAGGHAPLISPLAEINCLWYRFRVEEYRRSGKSSQWRTIEQGASERPFVLCDETGSCWVNPKGAEVHPRQRRRWEGRRRWPAGHALQTGLLGSLIGSRYRYTEEWFAEGETLYALGWFQSRGGGREASDSQSVARQLISHWKADYTDLLSRFDQNNDGRLDLQEWEKVRRAAEQEAARQIRAAGQAPVVHMLAKPQVKGLPFLLSDHHEEHLSQQLRRQSGWSLFALVLAGLVSGSLWLALFSAG
ncbi:GIDE domain-containing protein [Halopseudomonas pelagia]|uniref:GIDE domain-containing protein n=1 Tax=Halopseudomonas pelagia TaxID=553151 RepID=UPI00039DC86E|nr:GIDE domain-containing protein [Halopseudomonas pelagia]|tara:strand:- start:1117 stop:2049 length:933 start_codon:yes stop_codon:yes gene_type:complete